MSQSIYRVEYKNIPQVDGHEHANFIIMNFNGTVSTLTFYIDAETLKKLNRRKSWSKREKELLKSLSAECKAHGDFYISIA